MRVDKTCVWNERDMCPLSTISFYTQPEGANCPVGRFHVDGAVRDEEELPEGTADMLLWDSNPRPLAVRSGVPGPEGARGLPGPLRRENRRLSREQGALGYGGVVAWER